MTKAIVYVGLPGTGKSTVAANQISTSKNWHVYSTDAIIEEIGNKQGKTYNEVFKDAISDAQKQANELLANALATDKNIVWDQTNMSAKKRKSIVNRLAGRVTTIECNVMMPPTTPEDIAEWETRLANRPGKAIPESIVKSMQGSYECPSLDEGFSVINFYNIHGRLVSRKYRAET
jgi:predicted kinase